MVWFCWVVGMVTLFTMDIMFIADIDIYLGGGRGAPKLLLFPPYISA